MRDEVKENPPLEAVFKVPSGTIDNSPAIYGWE
jgi:hypothetical protein